MTVIQPDEFPAAVPPVGDPVRGRSLWDDARRRLFRNKAAVASIVVLALLVLAAIFGPYLTPYAYDQVNKNDVWVGPLTGAHLIGTDSLGRDLLARLLVGLRVSLAVGVVATFVSLVIGPMTSASSPWTICGPASHRESRNAGRPRHGSPICASCRLGMTISP